MSQPQRILLPLFFLTLMVLANAAQASEALRKEMTTLATSIKEVLAEEKRTDIAVGDFTGPPPTG